MTALRVIAESGEVVDCPFDPRGEYVVEGWLWAHTEGSRQRLVHTVWIIDSGREAPRLETAYPGKE